MDIVIMILLVIMLLAAALYSEYIGFNRYLRLKYTKHEGLVDIDNYKNLPKRVLDKFTIGMYLDSTDVQSSITATVDSLLDQTERVDSIIAYKDPDNNVQLSPDLKKKMVLSNCAKSYGSIGCIFQSMLHELDKKTVLLLVSPGRVYGYDFINVMGDAILRHPDHIIYNSKHPSQFNLSSAIDNGLVVPISIFEYSSSNITVDQLKHFITNHPLKINLDYTDIY